MIVRLIVVLALVLCCSTSYAEEVVEIPLKEIWADSMPGTINIYELEGTPSDNPLMAEINKKHGFKTWQDKAGPAFAVQGTGLEALKNAHAVITEKQSRPTSLPQDSEVSVIFFSLEFGNYVHLTKVERDKNTINIRYEFVPHTQKHLTRHFAIIPLGKLPKGQYKVDVGAEPFADRFRDQGMVEIPDERKLPRVSPSFEFSVK